MSFVVENLREWSYTIAGMIFQNDKSALLFSDEMRSLLLSSIFSELDYVESRHFAKLLLFFITPFTAACTSQQSQNVFLPCASTFASAISKRLTNDWEEYNKREQMYFLSFLFSFFFFCKNYSFFNHQSSVLRK